jgi:SAM-dependent methyltransferase
VVSLLNELGSSPLSVLDFGCGDGGLIRLLLNKGIRTLGVDPIPSENNIRNYVYPTLADLPDKRFDIIVCIEVLEHLDNPLNTLSQLLELLDDNGIIFLTTALSNRSLSSLRAFPHWIYLDDPTHIGFFHEKTFHWIAEKLSVDVHIIGCNSSIILLDKTFNRLIFTMEGVLRVYCDQKGISKTRDIDQSRPPIDELLEKAKVII